MRFTLYGNTPSIFTLLSDSDLHAARHVLEVLTAIVKHAMLCDTLQPLLSKGSSSSYVSRVESMTGRLQQILYALKLALPHTLTLEGTKEETEKASMAGMLFKVIVDRGW